MNKINVALIGYGYWGPQIARNLFKISHARLIYICDKDSKKLSLAKRMYPNVKCVSNIDQIINDANLSSVIIATPVSSHHAIAKTSLLANKHVLVEKPFTGNLTNATELLNISNKTKKVLMVSFPFIYSEPIKKMKEELTKKTLGELYYYDSTRVNLGLIKSDSDVISDLAIHDISILKFLLQKNPVSVSATGTSHVGKKTEIAYIYLKYADGFNAHINVSWLSPLKSRSIVIGGKKKMLFFNDIEPSEKIKIFSKSIKISKTKLNPFAPLYRSGDILIPYLEQVEPLENMLKHFLESIKNRQTPLSSAKFGIDVLKIILSCQRSVKEKREIRF